MIAFVDKLELLIHLIYNNYALLSRGCTGFDGGPELKDSHPQTGTAIKAHQKN